jgi:hypothetical protein
MHVTPPDPQYAPEPPTSYLPGATPPTGGQPTPRRSIPLLLALLGGAGLVLVSCLGGVAVGSAGSATKQVVSFKPSPYPVVSTVTVTKTVEVKPAAPAAPPPPPAAACVWRRSLRLGVFGDLARRCRSRPAEYPVDVLPHQRRPFTAKLLRCGTELLPRLIVDPHGPTWVPLARHGDQARGFLGDMTIRPIGLPCCG